MERHAMKNVGGIDRVIRVLVGLALTGFALFGGPAWAWIGVVPLATGLIGICPAYSLFGIKTCPTSK